MVLFGLLLTEDLMNIKHAKASGNNVEKNARNRLNGGRIKIFLLHLCDYGIKDLVQRADENR